MYTANYGGSDPFSFEQDPSTPRKRPIRNPNATRFLHTKYIDVGTPCSRLCSREPSRNHHNFCWINSPCLHPSPQPSATCRIFSGHLPLHTHRRIPKTSTLITISYLQLFQLLLVLRLLRWRRKNCLITSGRHSLPNAVLLIFLILILPAPTTLRYSVSPWPSTCSTWSLIRHERSVSPIPYLQNGATIRSDQIWVCCNLSQLCSTPNQVLNSLEHRWAIIPSQRPFSLPSPHWLHLKYSTITSPSESTSRSRTPQQCYSCWGNSPPKCLSATPPATRLSHVRRMTSNLLLSILLLSLVEGMCKRLIFMLLVIPIVPAIFLNRPASTFCLN